MKRQKSEPRYVVCVHNEGCDDLTLRTIYQILPDESAARDGYIRILDESGEDYLYPANYFIAIALPHTVEKALAHVS